MISSYKIILLNSAVIKISLVTILFFSIINSMFFRELGYALVPEQDYLEIARNTTVEIVTADPGRPKILIGSGVIVRKKLLREPVNPNDVKLQPYKYEYTVISNRHVMIPRKNEYFIRINGETRKLSDLYTTRENSSYDLALLKFRSDRNISFVNKSRRSISTETKFSINGWVEKKPQSRENELIRIDSVSKSHEDAFYLYYAINDKIEKPKDGMSGGSLLSSDGELIGIHAAKNKGISFNTVDRFYQSYLRQYRDDVQSPCFATLQKRCRISFIEM
jgi:hypothetical protein